MVNEKSRPSGQESHFEGEGFVIQLGGNRMETKKTVFFLLLVSSPVAKLAKEDGASPEEKKVADMIKTQNLSIKKKQEDVNKLLDKIVAAIELSCAGWVTDGISYYYMMSTKSKKMTDARKQCQNLGADLPIISSAKENNFILDLLEKEGKSWGWLGLQRNPSDLEFYWVNGSKLKGKYNAWNDGEPNNYEGLEHCAYMKGPRNINRGKWNDCRCKFLSARSSPYVVCQKTI